MANTMVHPGFPLAAEGDRVATLVAGFDGTNAQIVKTSTDGTTAVGMSALPLMLTADGAVKATPGTIHTVTFAPADATPTAGTIQVRNSASAGAGVVIFAWSVPAAYFVPFTVILDAYCSTAIYLDFTTTADVNVTATYW